MRLLLALILLPLDLAVSSDLQAERRLFLREGEKGSTEKVLTDSTGTDTQGMEMELVGMGARPNNRCPNVRKRRNKYDLGLRFNKFAMLDGSDITLDWKDYPLNDTLGFKLRNESNAISVITHRDYEVKGLCIKKYIDAVGGYPSVPSKNRNSDYWRQLAAVVEAQIERRDGTLPDPAIFTPPDLWKKYNVTQVAENVHDEFPGIFHCELLKSFLVQGLKLDATIFPFRSKSDFVGSYVRMAELNTWSIQQVAAVNFFAKWTVGRCRPEEVAWSIASGELTTEDGVPPYLVELIDSMKLENATSFTQYPEGSPRHPSWPAMHSAASSASLWLAVVAVLTPEQYCQVLRMDHAVAYARTCAGVHYNDDNTAGLNMGQEVISERLGKHLADIYGSNRTAVEAKIRKMRFDWNTYDPAACTVTPKYG